MADLTSIKNIVIVMMENRSFDHMLGYLGLAGAGVTGLSNDPAWRKQFTNFDGGTGFAPILNPDPYDMPAEFDPPHERDDMATNLGVLASGKYPMTGFVSGIPTDISKDPNVRKLVMSYFGADQVPINDFFARNYVICDNWFASLPVGTQPNRLMSMSGYTRIDVNQDILPSHDLVYDWLTRQGVSWRVYHRGIPFFTMMLEWIPDILGSDLFRSFEELENDLVNTPPGELPQVIFIEPTYQDSPHLGFATDDHAPSGVSNGQEFLMQIYNAVSNSPDFWKSTVMIVHYDENGGFFDHVSPPLIPTNAPPNQEWNEAKSFASLGVRTPALVISPFVKPGSVCHAQFDHISVLKFLGEKFGPKGTYSDVVDSRPVQSLSQALSFDNPIFNPPSAPALDKYLARRTAPPALTVTPANTQLQAGFHLAVENLKQHGADETHPKFGNLIKAMDNLQA